MFAATEGREAWRPEGWKDRVTEWLSATFRRPEDLSSAKKDRREDTNTDVAATGAVNDAADVATIPNAPSHDEAAQERVVHFNPPRADTAHVPATQAIGQPLDVPEEADATPLAQTEPAVAPARAAQTTGRGFWQIAMENRLAVVLTVLWVVALGAYGLGYLDRLASDQTPLSAVPTAELMFFAFSVAGPIGMLWIVVSLLNRTAVLSQSMEAQSESALALAMTVGNLQESVDGLAAGTSGRIETSLSSLETRTAASVVALDDAIGDALDETRQTIRARGVDIDDQLTATGKAISEVLSARVDILDRTLESASKKLDDAVADTLTAVNKTIRQRSETFEAALEAQRSEFGKRLETRAVELSRTLQTQAERLSGKIQDQSDTLARGLQTQADLLSGQVQEQTDEVIRNQGALTETLNSKTNELARVLQDQAGEMKRSQDAVSETMHRTAEDISRTLLDQTEELKRGQETASEALDRKTEDVSRTLQDQAEDMKRAQSVLSSTLNAQASELATALKDRSDEIKRAQDDLRDRVDESLAQSTTRIDAALGENLTRQEERLKQANRRYDETLTTMSGKVSEVLDARSRDIDAQLRKSQKQLSDAISGTTRTVEGDLKELLDGVRAALTEMQGSLAANPPATSTELADLLGTSAASFVRPERDALTDSVKRLSGLEDQARALLDKIDRTSRLNPLMAGDAAPGDSEIVPRDISASQARADVVALPFEVLPRTEAPGALNWTAVVHALGAGEPAVGVRTLVERVKADPQISTLLSLRDTLTQGLSQDELHVADLVPNHAEADLWASFARGARGGEVTMLAGIDDKVALTLTRARLRREAAFHEVALRFVEAFIAVLRRAVAEIGADQRLVEIADTETGRTFILLAPLTGALMPAADLPVSADG